MDSPHRTNYICFCRLGEGVFFFVCFILLWGRSIIEVNDGRFFNMVYASRYRGGRGLGYCFVDVHVRFYFWKACFN